MIEEIINFLQLSENLISGGMPTEEQLKSVAESGFQVVINLAPSTSTGALQKEEKIVTALGMQFINIPVIWNNPTRENLDEFMKAMQTHKDNNIFVHCQANYRATGFISMDRVLRLGWQKENAFEELRRIWDPAEYPNWQKFFDDNLTNQDQ